MMESKSDYTPNISKEDLIAYEYASLPRILDYLGFGWIGTIAAKYLAWKVNRKHNAYLRYLEQVRDFIENPPKRR